LVDTLIRLYFTAVFLFSVLWSQAQTKGFFHQQLLLNVEQETFYSVRAENVFSAFSVQFPNGLHLAGAYVVVDGDTFSLTKDVHMRSGELLTSTNLIGFNSGKRSALLFSGQLNGQLKLHFLRADPIHIALPTQPSFIEKSNGQCDEPISIDQSQWRSGLPAPDYNRIYTDVKHVIVHHSAGSNSNTNYTQVVRDIYLYHTQVNGWSDIGYNYLIAQDGTIFKGRDPLSGDQDNVQGAHFCGTNSNTMGICLLGTYSTTSPAKKTEESLFQLITWKLDKEQLHPTGAFPFSGLGDLNVVSGHRDGCSTECPGQQTYDRLVDYIKEVNERWNNCDGGTLLTANFEFFPLEIEEEESVTFTDLSKGNPTEWQWFFPGGSPSTSSVQHPFSVKYYYPGNFDVKLKIGNGTRQDSLTIRNAVKVVRPTYPKLAPNPANKTEGFSVLFESNEAIHTVVVYDGLGRKQMEFTNSEQEIQIPAYTIRSGMYYVQISDAQQTTVLPITIY
jgi:hypothetical protein